MHRQNIIKELEQYAPDDASEEASRRSILDFIAANENCFERGNRAGHVTGSALLVNSARGQALLNYHKFLDKWLCFGGHADGESDIFTVAQRETIEESGIRDFIPLQRYIFDLDAHDIPANPARDEPPHIHYDIAYLFDTAQSDFMLSDESVALRWVDLDDTSSLTDERLVRMMGKAKKIIEGNCGTSD